MRSRSLRQGGHAGMRRTRIRQRRGDRGSGRKAGFAISVMALADVLLVLSCGDGAVEPTPTPPAPVATTVTVNPGSAALSAIGETSRLTAEVRDENGRVMVGATVAWTTSDASVAVVDGSGLVTAASNGTATITATAGSASGTGEVTVAQVVSAVVVSPEGATLAALGDTLRLAAEAFDANEHGVAGAEFEWESSDDAVAPVDGSGLVTAASNGTATITATAGSASGTGEVTVAQVVSTVRILDGDDQKGAQGRTLAVPLVLRLVDGNEHPVAGARVDFIADDRHGTVDPASAVSDGSGQAKANWTLGMVVGRQTLTATAGGASAHFTATAIAILTSLSVDPPSLAPAEAGKQGRDTIQVTVTDAAGAPVANARYRWTTDRNSGWAFPAAGKTSAQGRISATWVAGWPGDGLLSLSVENTISALTTQIPTRSTGSANPPSGALYVNMHHDSTSAGYSIDITPLTEPQGTYYATIQWDGGYTGLQRGGSRYDRQLQFSMWNLPAFGDAQLVERGEGVVCRTFGGEGIGQACELEYPWKVGSTYRFEITEQELNGGSAMTLHVTDLANSQRRFVGTLRFTRRARMRSFHMFVEDFWTRAEHCLAREIRSAAIRRAMILIHGEWQPVTVGQLGRARTDPNNPGTPGCANVAGRTHAHGLEVIIGGEAVSDPDGSIRVTIPN